MSKRRYSGPPEKSIPAGGDWAETFVIRSTISGEDMITAQEYIKGEGATTGDAIRGTLAVAARLMLRWSLIEPGSGQYDADGELVPGTGTPLAITAENVIGLPFDMTKPLIDHINAAFLSIQTGPESATPS